MTPQQESSVQVLRAWQQVEFFRTYAVPEKYDQHIPSAEVSIDELNSKQNFLLPWIASQLKPGLGLDSYKKTSYTLYLGLFESSALSRIAEKTCGFNPLNADETEQRLDTRSVSCFATLKLDEHGSPLAESLAVSTLPWAMGKLLNQRATGISLSLFDADAENLKAEFGRIVSALPPARNHPGRKVLDAQGIQTLVESLYRWADLKPQDLVAPGQQPERMFRMAFSQDTDAPELNMNTPAVSALPDDEAETEPASLAILNSAAIRDIEAAITSVGRGTAGAGLMKFLSTAGTRHPDLYTDEALSFMAEYVHPGATPPGRWPADISRHLSFMQQFAINASFKTLQEEGLMSVNAPPGTGANELIQDIVAQNVVARATVLAGLSCAEDGLTEDGVLNDMLTGYEMIIACGDHAAAERMTRELSSVSSLAKCYRDISCFRPVAHQLHAQKKKNRLAPVENAEQRVWGTIAAVLGTKQKRTLFTERVFQENFWRKEPPTEREPANDYLNLWQFKQQYHGPSFETARAEFQAALKAYEALSSSFSDYDELCRVQAQNQQLKTSLKAQLAALKEAETELRESLTAQTNQQLVFAEEAEAGQTKLETIYPQKPGLFSRLLNLSPNREYQQKLQHQCDIVETLKQQIAETAQAIEDNTHALEVNQNNQAAIESQYENIQAELAESQLVLSRVEAQLAECQRPDHQHDMTDPELHQRPFWHNRKTNQLRSEVFITAMTLHQAWFIEALDNRFFKSQVRDLENLLSGYPVNRTVISQPALWRIFFMLVPVVSTTCSALSRMFAGVPEQTLGWVILPEAGKTEPQSAVGALMRAKRALMIGDSLQGQAPLCAPQQLVNSLITAPLGDIQQDWDPGCLSALDIADRVNAFGCTLDVMNQKRWIGIPLWLHHNSCEPMFSLTNTIAYNQRLIAADRQIDPAQAHPLLGNNRWINTPGRCSDGQYKEQLGKEVLALLLQAASDPNSIEGIRILSPFKSVTAGIYQYVQENSEALMEALNWDQHTLRYFLRYHTGTLSHFRGEPGDTVILVLGCDIETRSSAEWVASRPDLINVALNHAQRHLFVIGDESVWPDKAFVSSLWQALNQEVYPQTA